MERVRGTRDLFAQEFAAQKKITEVAQAISVSYGFYPISTPIIEHTEIFTRALGETSDVVSKEMYTFCDRGGQSLTLRPEFTASVVRAASCLNLQLPIRLFSEGPLFRCERPQAGRYRQFHQVNFECLGFNGPFADAELVKMSFELLKALALNEKVKLKINSLGCKVSRDNYRKALIEYLSSRQESLSEDSRRRLQVNPLRILDSKSPQDKIITDAAPSIDSFYTQDSLEHWHKFKEYLAMYGIRYEVDCRLVRGLDYYSHVVFEFVCEGLGAQSAAGGGGRYDGLSFARGNAIPAVGCAFGVERLASLMEPPLISAPIVIILPVSEQHLECCAALAQSLRQVISGPIILETEGKLASRLKRANMLGVKYAIFAGDEELLISSFKLRDLDSGKEDILAQDSIIDFFLNKFH